MKKIILLTILILFVFSATVATTKVLHIQEDNLFILYHPIEAAKKNKIQEDPIDDKINDYYELLGPYISSTMAYDINISVPVEFILSILTSFQSWSSVVSNPIFQQSLGFTYKYWYANDGDNIISIVKFTPREYIGFTAIYYNPNTMEIVDADIVLNGLYKWGTDGSPKSFDVENIMTHEIGHVCGLKDLYEEVFSELTMYGYGSKGETKKRTLEEGDIIGVQYLYGSPNQ